MAKVDSKGRIVLPKQLRVRLGITPGTEVEIREEDGKAVVEPKDDPDAILERMERLVEEASADRNETTPPDESAGPVARRHGKTVRRGAENQRDE